MKTYSYLTVLLCAFVLVHCQTTPKFQAVLDECQKEFGLSKESLISPDFEDPNIKCYAACVVNKDDRLIDGKLSLDKEMDVASLYMPEKIDDSTKDKMTQCVNSANEEHGDCEVSGHLYKCLVETFGPFKP